MYLQELVVRDSGPLTQLRLEPQFRGDGTPKPVVLVGSNGSGKTTVLSMVADALVELAATHFQDVAPLKGMGHLYFRLLGGSTVRDGSRGEAIGVRFTDGDVQRKVVARSGEPSPHSLEELLPSFPELGRQGPDSFKVASAPQPGIEALFRNGAYAFFPSSRSEVPAWRVEVPEEGIADFTNDLSDQLKKPIVIEHAQAQLKPWLIDLLLDSSVDLFSLIQMMQPGGLANLQERVGGSQSLQNINSILSAIMNEPGIHLVRSGRFAGARKLMVAKAGVPMVPTLDALSAGQASLFSIFATVVRYGDAGRSARPNHEIEGVVCIDEADAHLHPSLQHQALPNLMGLFPRVQFLVTSHSPLFPLGMRDRFGADGFTLIEMPRGEPVSVERYEDFSVAFRAFQKTIVFDELLSQAVSAGSRPVVYCEGQTDPMYLKAAAKALGFELLTSAVDFEWIGSVVDGQAVGGGGGALENAFKFLRLKPSLSPRLIVLLHDGDAKRPDADAGDVHVRSMPSETLNDFAVGGVETRLPNSVFQDDLFSESTRIQGTTRIQKRELNKVALCERVCRDCDPAVLEGFRTTLEAVQQLLG